MSYNQSSDYERSRLESEGLDLESQRSGIERSLQALEAEYESLRQEEATLASRVEGSGGAPAGSRSDASLEERLEGPEGDGGALEGLVERLEGVRWRLGQLPAELSTRKTELASVVSRLQALLPNARSLLDRDTGLGERISATSQGIAAQAPRISAQNSGAKSTLEGIVDTTRSMDGIVSKQVTEDARTLSWLERAAAAPSGPGNAPGYIDPDAIYGPPTYGGRKYPGIDRIQRSLLTPGSSEGYRQTSSYMPGAQALNDAAQAGYSVLGRGAEALRGYLAKAFGDSSGTASGAGGAAGLAGDPDFDPMTYYRPLQKVGEIAQGTTKSIGSSVARYAAQATGYVSSIVGSLFGRGR